MFKVKQHGSLLDITLFVRPEAFRSVVEKFFKRISSAQWRLLFGDIYDPGVDTILTEMLAEIVQELCTSGTHIALQRLRKVLKKDSKTDMSTALEKFNIKLGDVVTATFAEVLFLPQHKCESAEMLTELIENEVLHKVTLAIRRSILMKDISGFVPRSMSDITSICQMVSHATTCLKRYVSELNYDCLQWWWRPRRTDSTASTLKPGACKRRKSKKYKLKTSIQEEDCDSVVFLSQDSGSARPTLREENVSDKKFLLPGVLPEFPRPKSKASIQTSKTASISVKEKLPSPPEFDSVQNDVDSWFHISHLPEKSAPHKKNLGNKQLSKELTESYSDVMATSTCPIPKTGWAEMEQTNPRSHSGKVSSVVSNIICQVTKIVSPIFHTSTPHCTSQVESFNDAAPSPSFVALRKSSEMSGRGLSGDSADTSSLISEMTTNNLIAVLLTRLIENVPQKTRKALQTEDIDSIMKRLSRMARDNINIDDSAVGETRRNMEQVSEAVIRDLEQGFGSPEQLLDAVMASNSSFFDEAILESLVIHLDALHSPKRSTAARIFLIVGKVLIKPFTLFIPDHGEE